MLGHSQTKGRATGNPNLSLPHRATSRLYRPRENPGPPLYTAYEPDRCLRLVAEMKLPSRAWLEFEVHPQGDGAMIRQTAVFDPVGVLGLLYW